MNNLVLFIRGYLGELVCNKLDISHTAYTYSRNSTRSISDSAYTREGFYRYINERFYDPSKILIPEGSVIVCIDWTKDFFEGSYLEHVYYVHPSLLPRYRGYGTVTELFLNGVINGGVSLYKYNSGIDAGDIVFQDNVKINFNDFPDDYLKKCSKVIVDRITQLVTGDLSEIPVKQDSRFISYCKRHRVKDGVIDFNSSSVYVYNLIRAYSRPYFGARAFLHDSEAVIYKAFCEKRYGDYGFAGSIYALTKNGPEIACGEGTVILTDILYKNKIYKGDQINPLFEDLNGVIFK